MIRRRPAHAPFLRLLLSPVLVGALCLFASAAPGGPLRETAPEPSYDPELVAGRVIFDKAEYLVGEPAYFELELRNNSSRKIDLHIYPYFSDDIYCQVSLPGEQPFRYAGDDQEGVKQREWHEMMPGEKRVFNFRVYYDNGKQHPHPTNLLFYDPTQARLDIVAHYSVDRREQIFVAPPMVLSILEPAARNAECERLLRENNVSEILQRQWAKPEEFGLLENILSLYSDTVYAPHLAFALANGYLAEARKSPVDRELMRAAMRAFQTLLQVTHIPYIREMSLYAISHCHLLLGDEAAFSAWFERYLREYGQEGRYVFEKNPYLKHFLETREPDPGPHWNYYP